MDHVNNNSQEKNIKYRFNLLREKYKYLDVYIFTVGLILFVLLFLLTLNRIVNNQNNNAEIIFKIPKNITTTPVSNYTTQPASDPYLYKNYRWALKETFDGAENDIFYFSDSHEYWNISRWNNYLFFGSTMNAYGFLGTDLQENTVVVMSLNLDTGEYKTIYKQEDTRLDISDLQVINDTLYFTTGAYLSKGNTYWVDLNDMSEPQTLLEGFNGRIEKRDDRYWLITGEGDACWGQGSFSILDIDTKKVTHVADTHYGCSEGEEDLGVYNDKLLVSFHSVDMAGYAEDGEDGIYSYIEAIPLDNPENREVLLSKDDMPEGIRALKLSEDKNHLILFGSKIYILNLYSNELKEYSAVGERWLTSSIVSWKEDRLCLRAYFPYEYAELDINSGEVNIETTECSQETALKNSYTKTDEEKMKETLDYIYSLQLPENIIFKYEEFRY